MGKQSNGFIRAEMPIASDFPWLWPPAKLLQWLREKSPCPFEGLRTAFLGEGAGALTKPLSEMCHWFGPGPFCLK